MTANKFALWALLTPLVLGGCFKRAPLDTTTPAPDTRIVATLTDSGTVAMSNAIGAGALEVEGVVRTADANQWTLEMMRVDHRDQRTIEWNREPVSFPQRVLRDPFVIVLDKKRSWLAAAGITVGAFVVANAFHLIGADQDKPDETPPSKALVPVPPGGGNK